MVPKKLIALLSAIALTTAGPAALAQTSDPAPQRASASLADESAISSDGDDGVGWIMAAGVVAAVVLVLILIYVVDDDDEDSESP